MKFFKIFLLLFSISFAIGCTQKEVNFKHSSSHHHHKLRKPVYIDFKTQNQVAFEFKDTYTNMQVKIFLKDSEGKKLVHTFDIQDEDSISFDLPENLTGVSFIAAVIQGLDDNNNPVSAVDVYKVGEQEEIDRAKNKILRKNSKR